MTMTYEQTQHPCLNHRPLALAEQCEREGLDNAAATIRGLMEERAALVRVLNSWESADGADFVPAMVAASALMGSRDIQTSW